MRKLGIYIILFILIVILRDNICFFYGNVLGVFKLDNDYYNGIIKIKDEKIKYLEQEFKTFNNFSKELININYNYKISKIIYREMYKSNKYRIQYGKKDNVSKGLGVTNELGFIGKINKTNDYTSELINLKELNNLSVIVNNVYGKLNYDKKNNIFIIDDISNYDNVHINDEVYTSGYGTIKEQLYIGKVIKIYEESYKKKVIIESKVDFDNLNYVLIVGT